MQRIQLTDSAMGMVLKMSSGNPGAMSALTEILVQSEKIDPQRGMRGAGAILQLDAYGIYGSSIYILFNDKCHRDVRKMLVLLRAAQLGFLSVPKLRELAADQSNKVKLTDDEFNEIDHDVCERLVGFARRS